MGFLIVLYTSNWRNVSTSRACFCLRTTRWLWRSENSSLIICSLSFIASSLNPSSINLCLNLFVETTTSPPFPVSSPLFGTRGYKSFTACKASIHSTLSSLLPALKCNVFVPVNIENLLSSDLLSLIEET